MSTRRLLLTLGVVTALAMSAVATAGPAWGAPPSNDDIGGAVVITQPLPFTFTESTVEATASPEEQAFNSFCGAPMFEHAVWFTATAPADGNIAVDVTGSDYSAGIVVLTGTPGNLTPINCGPGRIGGPVTGGQTYYLLVFGDGVTTATSGNLVLTVANSFPLDVTLESLVAPLTFSLELVGGACDPGTLQLDTVSINGAPVTPLSFTIDPSNPDRARLVLAAIDAQPSGLNVTASCQSGSEAIISDPSGDFWGTIAVSKVVQGTAPAGSTFTIHVACTPEEGGAPLEANLAYPSTGGVQYVYSDRFGGDCAFTETASAGALSASIDHDHVTVEPDALATTVTNSFVVQAAVVIQPRFTG